MSKKHKTVTALVLIIAVGGLITLVISRTWLGYYLTPGNGSVSVPSRPASVPPSAVWAGGQDGGAWFDCSMTGTTEGRFHFTIFDDGGNMWEEGLFQWTGPTVSVDSLRTLFAGFTGTSILFRGRTAIVPIPVDSQSQK